MKLNKKLITAATTAGLLGLGASGAAHADALAFGNLETTDFRIFNATTGDQLTPADFDTLTISNNTTAGANLNSIAPPNPSGSDPAAGPSDVALQCEGPDCGGIAENDFTQQPYPTNLHFARGDALLDGSILDGGDGEGAAGSSVAEAHLNITDSGDAAGEVTTASGFSFSGFDGRIRIDFLADVLLHVALSGDANFGSAQADVGFSISITDAGGATVFDWTPDGIDSDTALCTGCDELTDPYSINLSRSVNAPGQDITYSRSGELFSALTPVLDGDTTYNFSINHDNNVDINQDIPAPATLALLGVGLLGMGATIRRGRNKA